MLGLSLNKYKLTKIKEVNLNESHLKNLESKSGQEIVDSYSTYMRGKKFSDVADDQKQDILHTLRGFYRDYKKVFGKFNN